MKGEEEVQDDTEHTYRCIDEFLEEIVNTSNMYESRQETNYDLWISELNLRAKTDIYEFVFA
jgi:hypothetical protein